jgi:hypothetical protein
MASMSIPRSHKQFITMKRFSLLCLSVFLYPCIADAQVVISSGETVKVTAADELHVQENLTNNSTLDFITFSGTAAQSISGTGTIVNLKLNKVSGTATIASGMQNITGELTLSSGELVANGGLTLKSTATGTARIAAHTTGSGSVSGNVFVERFIPSTASSTARPKQWRMLAFPYSGSLLLSNITGIGISYAPQTMMVFSESGDDQVNYGTAGTRNAGYQSFSSSSQSIDAGKGVATWIYGDNTATAGTGSLTGDLTISSSGTLNESGADVVMTGLTHTKQGWHLIGNPFASTIDWNIISPLNAAVAATIYRWDPVAANWTNYNSSGAGTGSRYIESGSAFFIKSAAGAPTSSFSLTIPQSAKATNAPNLHFSKNPFKLDVSGQRAGAASTLAGLRLKASGMGNPIPGEAYLDVSRTDATKGWDPQYDGLMMARTSGANIYFEGDKDNDYSMHFDRPLMNGEQRYYPITVTTPMAGETLIEIAPEGKWSSMHSVALIDKQLGRTILMRDGQISYKLRLEELKSEGRFLLAINHVKLSTDGQSPVFEAKALGNPISGNVIDRLLTHPTAAAKRWRVVDAMGREAGVGVFATDAGIQHKLTVSGMRSAGVYILQVEMDNGETQQLRIIKN